MLSWRLPGRPTTTIVLSERLVLPVELLKQTPPAQFAEEEERRLLFVAMTRARDRLLVTTVEQPGSRIRPSRFVAEVAPVPS
jgi:superfamily I DNA/RNA helicase